MIKPLYRTLIELTNGRGSSWFLQKFTKSRGSKALIPSYTKIFKIDLDEMEGTIKDYDSLHLFFIRNLKAGARPISGNNSAFISPVDAVIEQIGQVSSGKEIEIKNKKYAISEMFEDNDSLEKYINGQYMIFYLSPRDYHRIHSPTNGKIIKRWTLGKKSYPVNKLGLKYGRAPLIKNYRTITEIKHESGHMALVKVGAMYVNSIKTYESKQDLEKGEEMAYFTFGSTVVLFFEKNTFILDESIKQGQKIKVGQEIGRHLN